MKRLIMIEVALPKLIIHERIGKTWEKVHVVHTDLDDIGADENFGRRLANFITQSIGNGRISKVIWVIQPETSIRKELMFHSLTRRELMKVLRHEAPMHLHVQEEETVVYEVIQEKSDDKVWKVLLAALPNDIRKLYSEVTRLLGSKCCQIVERCDVLAKCVACSEAETISLVVDIEQCCIYTFEKDCAITAEGVIRDRLPIELLRKLHYYNEKDIESLGIKVVGAKSQCLEYVQQLQVLTDEEISCVITSSNLIQQGVDHYRLRKMRRQPVEKLEMILKSEWVMGAVSLVLLGICWSNLYLKQEIARQQERYRVNQQTGVVTASVSEVSEAWFSLSRLDAILSTADEQTRVLNILWRMLGSNGM